ncbi:IclR family transcriptional regulator [Thioclava sp. GXIMD2076]|uniref:IclR family transcriptional regulator n=1 Tax=unclassified Thioclava TaxID=2621713 RepID=UPI0030CD7C20
MTQASESKAIGVIARAATIFRVLERAPRGMSISELAREAALPRSTVHRLITDLVQEHLLLLANGRVCLGPALPRLAAANQHDVQSLSRPELERLAECCGETVNLSVLRADQALLVDQVASRQPLRVVSPVGEVLPLTVTAQGHAFLAALPEADLRARLGLEITQAGDYLALCKELDVIRRDGIAFEAQRYLAGVCAFALTLDLPVSERYALSVVLPLARLDGREDMIRDALRQAADAIRARF